MHQGVGVVEVKGMVGSRMEVVGLKGWWRSRGG